MAAWHCAPTVCPRRSWTARDSLQRFSGEFWLSPLAVIARPQTRDMLIVGFGGGVVVEGVPPSVRTHRRHRARAQGHRGEPRGRARCASATRSPIRASTIIVNDARGALRLTSRRYDAIVSQPSHPWTAGASHLYTREFMQLAHDHLTPGRRVRAVDERDLHGRGPAALADRDAARACSREVRVYQPGSEHRGFPRERLRRSTSRTQLARTGLPLRDAPLHYARFGINNVEDLVAALVLDTDGARRLATGAPLITDDDNRIATSSVFEQGRGMTGDTSGRLLAALRSAAARRFAGVRAAARHRCPSRTSRVATACSSMLDPSLADRVGRMAQILGRRARRISARATTTA